MAPCSEKSSEKFFVNPTMKTWLAAQELDVAGVDLSFDMLDNGDGQITGPELIGCIVRLKGPARSMDLHGVMHMISCLESSVKEVLEEVVAVKTGMVHHSSQGQGFSQ